MAGSSPGRPGKSEESKPLRLTMPADIRRQVGGWFDIGRGAEDVFWTWFRTVLPLLPSPEAPGAGPRSSDRPPSERVPELARDLVECAGERARLTIAAERYYRDNQVLARRLKALEATLRTLASAGHAVEPSTDAEASESASRYLPGP
jgi:hypothetical protein